MTKHEFRMNCGLDFGILELWRAREKLDFPFQNWVHFGWWAGGKSFVSKGMRSHGVPKFVEFAPWASMRHRVPKFTTGRFCHRVH